MPTISVIDNYYTAGPDKLRTTEAGLLNLLVKDDKGNVHQLMLENQSGIVPNKEPRFRSDDFIIQYVKHENGLYYLEEYIPGEESAVAMVAQRLQKIVKYRASSFSAVSYLSNVDETFI